MKLLDSILFKSKDSEKIEEQKQINQEEIYPSIVDDKSKITKTRLEEYIDAYGIEHDENFIYVYKAVDKNGFSFYDSEYEYEVNKLQTVKKFDSDIHNECGSGINALPRNKAIEYGRDQCNPHITRITYNNMEVNIPKYVESFKLLKLRIEKEKVLIPYRSNNGTFYYTDHINMISNIMPKVRTPEAFVVSEEVIDLNSTKVIFEIQTIEYDETNKNYKYCYMINYIKDSNSFCRSQPSDIYSYEVMQISSYNNINRNYFISDRLDMTEEEIQNKLNEEYNHMLKIAKAQSFLKDKSFTI